MTIADLYDQYLARAAEANRQAEMATDEFAKSTWLRVAAGYRDLAKTYDPRRSDFGWWN
jgi:hypothetical protein